MKFFNQILYREILRAKTSKVQARQMQLSITMAAIFDIGSHYKAQRDLIAKRCVQSDAYLKWTRSLTFDLRDQYRFPCTLNLVYKGELLPFRV